MTKKNMPFRDELHHAYPELGDRQVKNVRKRGVAIRLRALRDAKGLSRNQVAAAAGMTQSMIARLEALDGPMPGLESIERYIDACGGHFALLISDKQIDSEDPFRDAFAKARGRISKDIDLGVEDRQLQRGSGAKT